MPLLKFGWGDLRVIPEGRVKYIQAPPPQLYDLREDPAERRDLAREQPSRAEALRAALARVLDRERQVRREDTLGPSDEILEKLGALGYVGASGPVETATPGADPKDRIQEFRVVNSLIREALMAFHASDPALSIRKLRQVIGRGVESFEVHYYLARALAAQGRCAEALPLLVEPSARQDAWGRAARAQRARCRYEVLVASGGTDATGLGERVPFHFAWHPPHPARPVAGMGRRAATRQHRSADRARP